ncbi:conserved exported protein of unknown function [Modestobacter italicus]|uniref:Chaplin domain-containing protein n=1 Tax=Modestobacter italicus (strain DSM 44449 / CECT 9708 / BC 501) TaxID=2732864 RepID=I4EVE4_MODI5|nr:hypothetical protein [Modestobacter marinus]CCH87357.1 conserved exported protein of unknown function [Modestobacter marinus]
MQIRRTAATLASVAALGIGGVALSAPASAQPPIFAGGLVNVNITDVLTNNEVAVQVPIGVAANVCGVSAAVIAENLPAPVDCTAETTQDLPVRFRP